MAFLFPTLLVAHGAAAQQVKGADENVPLPALEAVKRSVLSPSLLRLVPTRQTAPLPGLGPGESDAGGNDRTETLEALPNSPLPIRERLISLRIVLMPGSEADGIERDLEGIGMRSVNRRGALVTGTLPIDSLGRLASLGGIADVRPSFADRRSGVTTTQGDAAANADLGRASFNVDGSGFTIGVLGDSYDCFGQAANDIVNGDLPTAGVTVLDDGFCGSDEGRAMLQIAHDLAPGAALAFHTAFLGELDFAAGIGELVQAGADIVVDDVFYYEEPFFQDGFIAQAARDVAINDDVLYLASAGNAGRTSWEGVFSGSGQSVFSTGDAHAFAPGDVVQRLTVAPFRRVVIVLQWDDPYTTLDPASPGPDTDLDIALLNGAGSVVALGADSNIGSDPYEVLIYNNGPSTQQLDLVIEKQVGPDPGLMKWIAFRGVVSIDEHDTASGTVVGHANAEATLSVGAVNYVDTPRFGTSPPVLAATSSAGPAPILFAADGTAIIVPPRDNPDLIAPDGGNNTVIGYDSDGDGYPNFFGTSAAVVHAAAAAALLLERSPDATRTDLETMLESTAIDVGVAGYDEDSGHGLIDADAALASVVVAPTIVAPATGTTLAGEAVEIEWAANDANPDNWRVTVGSTPPTGGAGSSDLFDSGPLGPGVISIQATGLPRDGSTLYLTLEWTVDGVVQVSTVKIQAAPSVAPSLVVPDPASIDPLPGSNVDVSWSSGTDAIAEWRLRAGTDGPLSPDRFDSGLLPGTATGVTVTGLPLDGRTVYLTLDHRLDGDTFRTLEYTFTAASDNGFTTVTPGRWHLLAVPTGSEGTFGEFTSGHLDPAGFADEAAAEPWVAYRYDSELVSPVTGAIGGYALVDLTAPLDALDGGFWLLHLAADPIDLDMPDDAVDPAGVAYPACAPGRFCTVAPLADAGGTGGWRIGAVPSSLAPAVSELRLRTIGTGTACDAGCDPTTAEIEGFGGSVAWRYDPQVGGSGAYVGLAGSDTLAGWHGFWVPTTPAGAQSGAELYVPVR